MTTTSAYLESSLTRWALRGHELRREAAFQKDLIEPLSLAAHANWLAMRERRRHNLRRLTEATEAAETRWGERLQRIEHWSNSLVSIRQEEERLRRLITCTLWLQKARAHQDAFIRRLERRSEMLSAEQHVLGENLGTWETAIGERAAAIEELIEKRDRSEQPFFVSRGRKQPEIDFLGDQQVVSQTLAGDLIRVRRSMRQLMDRLRRALMTVETHASGFDMLYEIHKQEIVAALKQCEANLRERQDQILSDALRHEAGRYRLRELRRTVAGLKCLEDIPQNKRRGLAFYFSKLTSNPKK